MNNRKLKEMLADSFSMEKELYDFCIECLVRIYGDESKRAVAIFEENYSFFDHCGCLQSLSHIDHELKKEREFREKAKELA